ncbi:MAG: hypothetical protein LBT67_02900 [Holosporaceae bacterium]|jgi:hypothetical protein|nr:hypothetical protein [Holosporaceae bacterium]
MRKKKFLLAFLVMSLFTIMGCEKDKLIEEGEVPVAKPTSISVYPLEATITMWVYCNNDHYNFAGTVISIPMPDAIEVELNGVVKECVIGNIQFNNNDSYRFYVVASGFGLTRNTFYPSWRVRLKKWGRYGEWVNGPAFSTGYWDFY